MNYGYLFSHELQKVAFDPFGVYGAMDNVRKAGQAIKPIVSREGHISSIRREMGNMSAIGGGMTGLGAYNNPEKFNIGGGEGKWEKMKKGESTLADDVRDQGYGRLNPTNTRPSYGSSMPKSDRFGLQQRR